MTCEWISHGYTWSMPRQRDHMLTLRCSELEISMLRAVALHTGLSQSDVLRQLVRREHLRLGLGTPRDKKRGGSNAR